MRSEELTTEFYQTITQLYGDDGKRWLTSLPDCIAICAKQWGLTDLIVSPHLSFNYILMARRSIDNAPVVIKLGYDAAMLQHEQLALELYNGNGCVRLLAHDTDQQALLLEQLLPARPLSSSFPHQEELAIEQAVRIMNQLHTVPLPKGGAWSQLPHIDDWLSLFEHLDLEAHTIPLAHLRKARTLAKQLLATQRAPVLLHGDLHQGNILSDGATWRAIDPKGVVGEPAYEVGTFIRNPTQLLVEHEQAVELIRNRIDRFSQLLQIDRQRIKEWSYVQAVLAAVWNEQDDLECDDMIRVAELIDQA
ncbi:phosphotransferase [Candidatus Dependentiae bacterium]|nr:phosphotransferase [Candidatus Dependentiae bacterium]MCC7415174.1 phosphotransferase [Campylobacterota bacterium]